MPITVRHEPSADVIASLAAAAGAGQYQSRQDALALQYAQLAQQDAQQQRSLQAQMMGRQMDQQSHLQNMAIGQQFDMARMQQQDQMLGARQAADDQRQAEMRQAAAEQQWQAGATDDMDRQIGGTLAGFGKQLDQFSPEGRRLYSDVASKYRAIVAQKPNLRPQQYGAAMTKLMGEMQSAGLENHINKPVPVDEDWNARAFEVGGAGSGRWVVRQSNGDFREFAPKPSAKSTAATPATFGEYYADLTKFHKDYDAIAKQLASERADEAFAQSTKDKNVAPRQVTPADVHEAMEQRFEAWRAATGRMNPAARTNGAALPPTDLPPPFASAGMPAPPGQLRDTLSPNSTGRGEPEGDPASAPHSRPASPQPVPASPGWVEQVARNVPGLRFRADYDAEDAKIASAIQQRPPQQQGWSEALKAGPVEPQTGKPVGRPFTFEEAATILMMQPSVSKSRAAVEQLIQAVELGEVSRVTNDGRQLSPADIASVGKQLLDAIQQEVDKPVPSVPLGYEGRRAVENFVARPRNAEEFSQLATGAPYYDPNGTLRRKP